MCIYYINKYVEYTHLSISLQTQVKNMKLKYFFALILVLSTLFLLGTVMASENVDYNANSSCISISSIDEEYFTRPDADCDDVEAISSDSINEKPIASPSGDKVDLSADMELGDVKKNTYGINEMSFDVPLIIHAKVIDGIAKNTKVYIIIPEEFEFLSSSENSGTYNPETKIWDLSDLQSGINATLTIFTKINTKGKFTIYVNATTDSNDTDLTNNDLKCDIEVTSKISSNTTRTSAQQNEAQHNMHYASIAQGANRQINWENLPQPNARNSEPEINDNPEETPTDEENKGSNEDPTETNTEQGQGSDDNIDPNPQDENGESSNSVSKEINTNIFSSAADTISDVISSIFNPDSKSNDGNPFNSKIVKAIAANDYRTIAILIFSLFLIIFICNLGYEKIKS